MTPPTGRLKCSCSGSPMAPGEPCPAAATQEDFLCDHCRELDCPTITTWAEREHRLRLQTLRIQDEMRAS